MLEVTQPIPPVRGYFSRIELRDSSEARAFVARFGLEGYGLHQALWRLFAAEAGTPRDFLYRIIDQADRPAFYVVSARSPVMDLPIWRIQTRDYAPCLQTGDRLVFSLRANPTVKRAPALGARSVRHDVVMDARKRGDRLDPLLGSYHQPGLAWLTPRAEAQAAACSGSVGQLTFADARFTQPFMSNIRPAKVKISILCSENQISCGTF